MKLWPTVAAVGTWNAPASTAGPVTLTGVEVAGSEAFVLSCLRALERFEILEVARSGAVALESGAGAGPASPNS